MARKDEIQKLKTVLTKRRSALRQALEGDHSLLREMNSEPGDVVDFALESASDEINSQLAGIESRELELTNLALKKMELGNYGKCEHCQRNIPLARLQALPYAILCVDCKRLVEENKIDSPEAIDWTKLVGGNPDDSRMGDVDFNVS